jgi:hypothetical protein
LLEQALSPRTRSGVVQGRPVVARGTRMPLGTWPNAVASLTLPGREHDRQRQATAINGEVDLGGQSAAAAPVAFAGPPWLTTGPTKRGFPRRSTVFVDEPEPRGSGAT